MVELTCTNCKEDDFYYESRYSESGDIGWKCLSCHSPVKQLKMIEELESTKLKEKISCIVMDMQGCGVLTYEDSSFSELNDAVYKSCLDSKERDDEFIICTIFKVSQGEEE